MADDQELTIKDAQEVAALAVHLQSRALDLRMATEKLANASLYLLQRTKEIAKVRRSVGRHKITGNGGSPSTVGSLP